MSSIQASQVAIVVKNPSANAGDIRHTGSILWRAWQPIPGSCLEDPMDQEPGGVYSIAKNRTQLKWLSTHLQADMSSIQGFPGGSVVKNPPVVQATRVWSLCREDSPGGGNGNALQYSCLGNPIDRGAWRAAVLGVTKELDILEQLSTHTYRGIYRCSNVYKGKNITRYLYIN